MAQTLDTLGLDINLNVSGLAEVQQVQRRMQGLDRQVRASTQAVRDHARSYNYVSRDMRRWAQGAMQQAGYQVGDFFVQITNGTNAMQAFGQQGAQLLGIFGPIGAVAGAAVAIFAAFAVVIDRTSGSASNMMAIFGVLREPIEAIGAALSSVGEMFGSVFPFIVRNIDTAIIAAGLWAAVLLLRSIPAMIRAAGASAIMTAAMAQVRAAMLASAISAGRFSVVLTTLRAGTLLLGGAIRAVTMIMMRFLPFAIIAAVAWLISAFLQLRRGAGSVAEAFNLLKDVAAESFSRMLMRGQLMVLRLRRGFNDMKSSFIAQLVPMAQSFDDFVNYVVSAWNQVFQQFDAMQISIGWSIADQMRAIQDEAENTSDSLTTQIDTINDALGQPNAALQRLLEAFRNGEDDAISFGGAVAQGAGTGTDALTELQQRAQDIARTMQSSMTDAFMSIVDGTKSAKDAFREMARAIIAKLYEVLVVQQLVGDFNVQTGTGTGLVGALMGAFVPGRAIGGPITGGKPYMVGERGPELVVPSRNGTVIPNNQLGGGQPVQVVYNFQGGVTEADLGRALPLLVERTKREVVEAVQRGGSVARVFS